MITVLLILVLGWIAYQDLKSREIYTWHFAVLFTTIAFREATQMNIYTWLESTFTNLIFLGVQLGLLMLYILLKYKSLKEFTSTWLGWGDILFLMCISGLFSISMLMFFYCTGLLLTLIFTSLIPVWKKGTIPLAGSLSIYLMILLSLGLVFEQPWMRYSLTNFLN